MDAENFDWFIAMIESGKTVNIDPMVYGDFLKYVTHVGKAPTFEKHMVSKQIDTGEDEWDAVYIQVNFHYPNAFAEIQNG